VELAPGIRRGTRADAAELLAIYAPLVETTAITFETVPPSVGDFGDRIEKANESHAWLVLQREGRLAGYAYGGSHRARAAYGHSAEVSVYLHEDFRGKGVGMALYSALFPLLADLGYYHAYAGITLPNEASVALHKSAGFGEIGVFPSVGYKFGQWHDVSWWHRVLREGKPEGSVE
jgi:phosphinothricin acetyltransferase